MKVLIIGQGGREHALVKSLTNSPSISQIHVIPGNDGMSKEALCHNMDWKNSDSLIQFCHSTGIEYVIIGPDDPVVDGLADRLRARGILVVAPSGEAAQLEGSKIYAKEFMIAAGVPTAKYHVVNSVEGTMTAAANYRPPYVLKADGLAAGKGVFICSNLAELEGAARRIFEERIFGTAGDRALLEEALTGWELSFTVLTNGQSSVTLPLAQDHKRLRNGHAGPNTGGMGTVAPLLIDPALAQRIESEIIVPTIALIKKQCLIYRGILFVGIMVTPDGPKVLEYNVRLGDPETQVMLPLIENDMGFVFSKLSRGELEPLHLRNMSSCCVILAAPGYPEAPTKGLEIVGNPFAQTNSSYFIHAGTKFEDDVWKVNGGRVLGSVGLGSTRAEAVRNAYKQAEQARWDGQQLRTDIGSY